MEATIEKLEVLRIPSVSKRRLKLQGRLKGPKLSLKLCILLGRILYLYKLSCIMFINIIFKNITGCLQFIQMQEQDKSSDVEKQPPSANTLHQIRGGYNTNGNMKTNTSTYPDIVVHLGHIMRVLPT